MDDEILVEVQERVGIIWLNRPQRKNAFNSTMISQWVKVLQEWREDERIHVIVLTGKGDAFCSGGDLDELATSMYSDALSRKNELWTNIHRVAFELERIDKPVVAAINGVAVGAGLDMALLCDLRFMSEQATVSEGYVKVGLVPGDGGAYLLPKLIGKAKALEMLWSGDKYTAQEALEMGLVNRIYPHNELLTRALEFSQKLSLGPSTAIRMMKRAVYQSDQLDLRTAFDLMSSHFSIIRETSEHREAILRSVKK